MTKNIPPKVDQLLGKSIETDPNKIEKKEAEGVESKSSMEINRIKLCHLLLTQIQKNWHKIDNTSIVPRLNQIKALESLVKFLSNPECQLKGYFVQPTGAGKTLLQGIIAKLFDQQTTFFVPRTALLHQTREELISIGLFSEDEIGIIGNGLYQIGRKITITTYQSHLSQIQYNKDYIAHTKGNVVEICDEAHRSIGDKTLEALNHDFINKFIEGIETESQIEKDLENISEQENIEKMTDPEQKAVDNFMTKQNTNQTKLRLGFTATPGLSEKHIHSYFGNTMIAQEKYSDLVKAGVLVPFSIHMVDGELFLDEFQSNLQLDADEEAKILEKQEVYRKLLTQYQEVNSKQHLMGAAFCRTISECDKFIEIAENEFNLKCRRLVEKDTQEDIKSAEKGLLDGTYDLVVSVDKIAEGWNFKPLNAIILARFSISPARIIQPAGRASRSSSGKEICHIFETDWKVYRRSMAVTAAEKSPNKNRQSPLPTQSAKPKKAFIRRFNIIEALLKNGENTESIKNICSQEQGSDLDYQFQAPITEMDRDYYNETNVRADLKAFADILDKDIASLTTGNFQGPAVICSNNEHLTFQGYIIRASRLLGFTDNGSVNAAKTLHHLKSILNIQQLKMDIKYFEDRDIVRRDLEIFASTLGIKHPCLMNSNQMTDVEIICQNGEKISGKKYLRRSAVALNNSTSTAEGNKLGKFFSKLLEIANYSEEEKAILIEDQAPPPTKTPKSKIEQKQLETPFNLDYFQNADYVRTDLEKFSHAAQLNTPLQISSRNIDNIKITAANDIEINGRNYLTKAIAAYKKQAISENKSPEKIDYTYALIQLKITAGFLEQAPIPFDQEYFSNAQNIQKDLQAFADNGGYTSIEKLTTTRMYEIKASCQNSQIIPLSKYLFEAEKTLGNSTSVKAARKNLGEILKKLKLIAANFSKT